MSVISASGCYFRTVDTQPAETVLELRIEWREASFETWARTVHAVAGDGMGLAFMGTDPIQMRVLARWIEEIAQSGTK